MEILRRKNDEVSYPLGETDQYEDQSKDMHLNSILKEELSDCLDRGNMSRRGFVIEIKVL